MSAMTLFADVVAASERVAGDELALGARSRSSPSCCGRLEPDEVPIAVGFLSGVPRQGRVGVGYATVYGIEVAARGGAVADGRRRRRRDHRDRGDDGQRVGGRSARELLDDAARPGDRARGGASCGGCSPASCARARSPG